VEPAYFFDNETTDAGADVDEVLHQPLWNRMEDWKEQKGELPRLRVLYRRGEGVRRLRSASARTWPLGAGGQVLGVANVIMYEQ
jgi:hypothetical protein